VCHPLTNQPHALTQRARHTATPQAHPKAVRALHKAWRTPTTTRPATWRHCVATANQRTTNPRQAAGPQARHQNSLLLGQLREHSTLPSKDNHS
jgi:hypothetical protein